MSRKHIIRIRILYGVLMFCVFLIALSLVLLLQSKLVNHTDAASAPTQRDWTPGVPITVQQVTEEPNVNFTRSTQSATEFRAPLPLPNGPTISYPGVLPTDNVINVVVHPLETESH